MGEALIISLGGEEALLALFVQTLQTSYLKWKNTAVWISLQTSSLNGSFPKQMQCPRLSLCHLPYQKIGKSRDANVVATASIFGDISPHWTCSVLWSFPAFSGGLWIVTHRRRAGALQLPNGTGAAVQRLSGAGGIPVWGALRTSGRGWSLLGTELTFLEMCVRGQQGKMGMKTWRQLTETLLTTCVKWEGVR